MAKNSKFLKLFLLGLIITCSPGTLFAQVTLGARELSMGQATTALPESDWSVFANPAMLTRVRSSVSFFGVRYYGFDELTDMAASATLVTGLGTVGFGAHRFGDELYSESRLRVIYKNEYREFHFGLAAGYNHVSMGGDYGSVAAIGVDVGLAATIIDGLWFGAKATNINQPKYGAYNEIQEEPARELSIGLSYKLSDFALFSTDVLKDVRFPISYRAGVEVAIFGLLKGRAGVTTEPVTFAGGFGYETKVWGVNVAVQQHENPVLGLSPGFDLRISW